MKTIISRTGPCLLLLTVFLLLQPLTALAVDVTFSWLPNTEPTLAGYKIHYGTSSHNYTEVVDIGKPDTGPDGRVHGSVSITTDGTYYFAATAYDVNGIESEFSDEIVYTVVTRPPKPSPNVWHLQ